MIKNIKKIILQCLVACCCSLAGGAAAETAVEGPSLATWYSGKDAAVSLRFDDNHESHVNTVVPLLNAYNFKGTFMVSPGRSGYLKYKDFWETELPAMGHKLGNHTMRHSGARDLKEADYEIGEAARIIRRAYPAESVLMVFASGGGETWGGKAWEEADPAFWKLVEKYYLLDLYDGNHPSIRIDASTRIEEICDRLDKATAAGDYQPFHFHNVGRKPLSESLKTFVRRYDLSVSGEKFREILDCLLARQDALWIAPIVDIMKYDKERNGAVLKVLDSGPAGWTVELAVRTDPSLYDHLLTLKIPKKEGMKITGIFQGSDERTTYRNEREEYLVDVEPVNSVITINYHNI